MLQIGVAFDTVLLGSDALSGAVLALGAIGGSTVNLVQDCIVNIAAKGTFNGFKICLVAIAGKLDAIGKNAAISASSEIYSTEKGHSSKPPSIGSLGSNLQLIRNKLIGPDPRYVELTALNVAKSLNDLSPLKSIGLHKLKGSRKFQWA